ncbi:MAG: hypothetical protein RMJ38_02635 [candidate division WOR-3 bacterium]|nr:hypothetical protein [candidate division WOR-3 bacterium]MDW8150324.1 hypothetical protein [candidate division WOR-3 bacterium]
MEVKGGKYMSEEKLLDMWQSITGYIEDWETKFSEILDELESLNLNRTIEDSDDDYYEDFVDDDTSVDALIEEVKLARSNLRETIKQALLGEISSLDVEDTFRSVGEFLREVEEKIMKYREMEEFEDFERDDYYDEENS